MTRPTNTATVDLDTGQLDDDAARDASRLDADRFFQMHPDITFEQLLLALTIRDQKADLTHSDLKVETMTMQSPELDKFLPAYIAAKKEFGPIMKETNNPAFRSKYEDLRTLLAAVEPALLDSGIVVVHQTSCGADGKHTVFTRLLHTSGQWMGSMWKLSPTKSDPQGEGSALTYARRYQLKGLLSVAAEDDDANAASGRSQQNQQRPQAPRSTAPARKWLEEAQALFVSAGPPEATRIALLQLMEACERAEQMTPALNKAFIEMGKTVKARVEALQETAKEAKA